MATFLRYARKYGQISIASKLAQSKSGLHTHTACRCSVLAEARLSRSVAKQGLSGKVAEHSKIPRIGCLALSIQQDMLSDHAFRWKKVDNEAKH